MPGDIKDKKKAYQPPSTYQKSNFMIGAKYRSSLLENKILAIALAKIQQRHYTEEQGSIVLEMRSAELRDLLHSNSGSFYSQLDPVAAEMTGRTIGWTDPESREFDYISVVTRATYKEGIFRLKFNSDLKKYMSQLKDNFTILSLPTMLDFESVYTFRLYELLRARAFYASGQVREDEYFEIRFEVSELRLNLGVVNAELDEVKRILRESKTHPDYDKAVERSPEKTFKTWGDFKRRVIDVAVDEINQCKAADMHIEYATKKGGRGGKVYAIIFYVQLNASKHENDAIVASEQLSFDDIMPKEAKAPDISEDEKIEFFMEVGKLVDLPVSDIRSIAETAGYDPERVKNAVAALNAYKERHEVASDVAFLRAAIQGDYKVDKKGSTGKNGFHNYTEADYDFEAIEKQLLNQSY